MIDRSEEKDHEQWLQGLCGDRPPSNYRAQPASSEKDQSQEKEDEPLDRGRKPADIQ